MDTESTSSDNMTPAQGDGLSQQRLSERTAARARFSVGRVLLMAMPLGMLVLAGWGASSGPTRLPSDVRALKPWNARSASANRFRTGLPTDMPTPIPISWPTARRTPSCYWIRTS